LAPEKALKKYVGEKKYSINSILKKVLPLHPIMDR
jgi:hypothetical protein